MGPGGLRGLQILRSGASRVRGGFDSHAFPPLAALLGLALGLVALVSTAPDPAWGAGAVVAADSAATGETPAAGAVAADSTASRPRRHPAARPLGRFDKPHWVMLRSAVVPGWGQAHNGAWLKAIAIGGSETVLGVRTVRDERDLGRLNDRAGDAARLVEADQAAVAAATAEKQAAQASGDTARIAAAQDAFDRATRALATTSADYNDAVIAYNAVLDRATNRRWLLGGLVAYALLDAYIDAHFRNFRLEFEADPALPGDAAPVKSARLGLRMAF